MLRKLYSLILLVSLFMAAPTFVSAGAMVTDLTGAASTTPTPPAHVADDILIAVVDNAVSGELPTTSTSGWAEILDWVSGTGGSYPLKAFWKRATGAGTAGPTITANNTDQFAMVFVVRGCVTTGTPYERAKFSAVATWRTPPTSEVITQGTDRLIVGIAGVTDDTQFSSGYPPSGWTGNAQVLSADGTDGGFHIISKTRASAGTEAGVDIGTWPANEVYQTLTLAFIPVPSGTQFTQNLGGSITPAGALKKDVSQKKTSSITAAGALKRDISHFKAGSLTPSGIAIKLAAKILGGSVSPSATLQPQRVFLKDLDGSITAAGAIVKSPSKQVAGAIAGSGAIAKTTSKKVAGSSTPSGAIAFVKSATKQLAGSIAASGAIAKQAAKNVGGVITPAGSIAFVKSFFRTFTGSIAASGALQKLTSKTVAGSSTPSGALATLKSFTKQLAGSITPSGAISFVKSVVRTFTGTIAPSGSLMRSTSIVRGGSITVGGILQKAASLFRSGAISTTGSLTTNQPGQSLTVSGSVTPSGMTKRAIAKQLAGSLSPIGAIAKSTSIVKSGVITASGVLSAVSQKLLTVGGSITAAGTIKKSIGRSVGGAIAPSGVLTRSISKVLGGVITAAGNLLTQMLGAFVAGDARTYMQLSADVTAGIDPGVSTELLLIATARTWLQEDPE